jgi:hypothetical protein
MDRHFCLPVNFDTVPFQHCRISIGAEFSYATLTHIQVCHGGKKFGSLRFRLLGHASAHPEAAAAPIRQTWKSGLEILRIVMVEIAIRH